MNKLACSFVISRNNVPHSRLGSMSVLNSLSRFYSGTPVQPSQLLNEGINTISTPCFLALIHRSRYVSPPRLPILFAVQFQPQGSPLQAAVTVVASAECVWSALSSSDQKPNLLRGPESRAGCSDRKPVMCRTVKRSSLQGGRPVWKGEGVPT